MKISRIEAQGFMSFSRIDLALDAGTTVVTGPNAVGKSNLGRIIDVARLVVASHAGSERRNRLDVYARAPRHGARHFRLIVGIEMDQPWEQELVAMFVRLVLAASAAALTPGVAVGGGGVGAVVPDVVAAVLVDVAAGVAADAGVTEARPHRPNVRISNGWRSPTTAATPSTSTARCAAGSRQDA